MAKRILIIDDQPFMIKLIQYNLKKQGYETITETDGLKALDKIEEIAPDLVFLDVRMPNITGTALCAQFRQKEIMKDIPIVILTGQLQETPTCELHIALLLTKVSIDLGDHGTLYQLQP